MNLKNRSRSGKQPLCRILEKQYKLYNHRKYVIPDPLQYLYRYRSIHDREIAGLVASSLAYGRVDFICKSVGYALDKIGKPTEYLEKSTYKKILRDFDGFRHRFTSSSDIAMLLTGVKKIINEYGSIERCMVEGMGISSDTVIPAMKYFVETHSRILGEKVYYLLPSPENGSACKRLNLYMKWMVRKDNVDPGGWKRIPASKLVMPLDTHIHRICTDLGLLSRKSANLRSALEITEAFRQFAPDDPTRYDFALTRMGMWDHIALKEFYDSCGVENSGNNCTKAD